jgi:hypothetical protein
MDIHLLGIHLGKNTCGVIGLQYLIPRQRMQRNASHRGLNRTALTSQKGSVSPNIVSDGLSGRELEHRALAPALPIPLASHLDKFSQAVYILMPERQFNIAAESEGVRSEYVPGRLPDPLVGSRCI